MTREEEIKNEATNYGYLVAAGSLDRWHISRAFEQGAEWAVKNLQSPWISVEDDLPCNHEELLIKSSDKRTTTKVVVIVTKDYAYSVNFMENDGTGWKWFCDVTDITYWMAIPEIKK